MCIASNIMLLLLFSACCAYAYSNGAQLAACNTLTPLHENSTSQISRVPFTIDLDQFEVNGIYQYTPSKEYTLTISGPEDDYFKGFFVQSRLMSDDTTRVGVFAATDPNSRLSSCPKETDGVTHREEMEFKSMEMGWTAPPAGTGPIRFAFAIVHEFDEFWADQRTEMLEEGPATSKASGVTVSVLVLLLLAVLASLQF
ncbi:Reelin domain-containing protein 1 [Geodia barretti]|uniref:Reelin domain-containing protein 1 n=1 Tax=Geodia barretti TaxID=519541 RepID=A0AA35SNP0_GEOBA|nr:Reelin domain-containing protein 1 [Geodia barretti]